MVPGCRPESQLDIPVVWHIVSAVTRRTVHTGVEVAPEMTQSDWEGVRAYISALTVQERRACAAACGVSLYTLNDLMRNTPRRKRLSPKILAGLCEHSGGKFDKTALRPDIWSK